MPPPQGALDARVSSEQQADAHTVARQVAALRERGAAAGLTVSAAMPCLAAGESGATRGRPALARWRAVMAAGRVDRL
jgi:site-specific DNA recombinase